MQSTMTFRRYMVLVAVMLGASLGDTCLGIGMKHMGPVSIHHLSSLLLALRIQNSESNVALWHSLRELEAQEKVADLQQQIAQDTLSSIETQMEHGSASAAGAPITPQQAQEYRIDERTGFVDLQDAQFGVTRVKLNLLNAIGGLEDWAKAASQTTSGSHIAPEVLHP